MKGNKKLLVIAALFLFVGVGVATYAIYKTTVSGTATVTAARWEVNFKNTDGSTLSQNFDLEFTGDECRNNHVLTGKIAPGASCTKTISIDASNAEVDVAYEAEVTGDVTFTKNNTSVTVTGANAFTATLSPETGTIAYNAGTKTATITLTVAWAGLDDSNTDTINAADTALAGATIKVPVKLTAKQVPATPVQP